MSIALILQAIVAALKFPEEMRKLIKLLSDSPEEKRIAINAQVDKWMEESAKPKVPGEEVGDPTWEK